MCDSAYHQEARRKARVLQRQQEFLKSASTSSNQAQPQPPSYSAVQTRPHPTTSADQNMQLDSGFRSSQHTRGLWGMDMNKPPKDSYSRLMFQRNMGLQPTLHPHWHLWDKELKQHSKVLRNNFMYMGPTHSFAHLYEGPKRLRSGEFDQSRLQQESQPAMHLNGPNTSYGFIGTEVRSDDDYWPLD